MKRFLIVGVIAFLACQEGPTSLDEVDPPATVDPLDLVTICQQSAGAAAPVTTAVAQPAADALIARGEAQRGPCAPVPDNPAAGFTVPQLAHPAWCPAGPGSEIAFSWKQGPDPQKRIYRYELRVQHAGSPYPLAYVFAGEASYLLQSCGYAIEVNRSDWWWRVRAIDNQGQAGPWSNTAWFNFGPRPAPLGSAGAP